MSPGPHDVLFVSSYSGLGGGETSLLSLWGALDRRLVRPALLMPQDGPLGDAARAMDVPVHILPYRGASTWFVPAIWTRLPAARAMTALVGRLSPHVVHADFHALPYASAACRQAGVALLYCCWAWWFRPRPWQRRFYRHHVTHVVTASHAIRDGLLGGRPALPPGRVSMIYPGVDVERFRPRPGERPSLRAQFGLDADGPVVTLLARFQRVKGHDDFLRAARVIAARAPSTTFVVAGDEPFGRPADAAFGDRMRAEAAADPLLAPRVRFIGRTGAPERLLAASDVLACSSRFETFGMALVEAMSCGVPVVSTSRGGPSEIVADGETGWLVPPGRPDLLASRVLDLLADAGARARFGASGRRRAEAMFAATGYAARYTELVARIAGRTRVSD